DAGALDAGPEYARRVIHHDFFHLVDERDGRLLADPEWVALNPPGFQYGRGGRAAQADPTAGELTDTVPGCVSRSAASAPEEDKAELFSALMTDPRVVDRLAEGDAVGR